MRTSYSDEWATLHTGTALDVLRQLPERSVHMCVTSPPYWGLRSYLPKEHPAKDQELGTERTPDEFVEKLVEVFGEVWRVLRDDGTLWVNIGDTYVGYWGDKKAKAEGRPSAADGKGFSMNARPKYDEFRHTGLKPKDLCLIPARLAIALQSWGWYLRQELVWSKDSAMPESVRDRCTRSHEFVYMLTKKPRYFYDAEAIKEPAADWGSRDRSSFSLNKEGVRPDGHPKHNGLTDMNFAERGRNARSVWRINPKPYPSAHYAVFPPELPIRTIKAGTSEKGVCSECGAPWKRVVGEAYPVEGRGSGNGFKREQRLSRGGPGDETPWTPKGRDTVGWEPTCTCGGPDDLQPGDFEVIATPTGERNGSDPSKETGRAGYNRPRHPEEGQRPITRYEQRHYAAQLKASEHRSEMAKEAGGAFAHYARTDRSGARPIPQALLDAWIGRDWLKRVVPPEITPPEVVPATVLDPFAGSGTTLYAARKLGRRSIGIDIDEKSAQLLQERLGDQGVLL